MTIRFTLSALLLAALPALGSADADLPQVKKAKAWMRANSGPLTTRK